MSGLDLDPDTRETDVDAGDAVERIEARVADIRARQVDRALAQCAAHGDLTADQEHAIEELADNVVDALLDTPREAIRDADDPEKLRTAIDLFDPTDP